MTIRTELMRAIQHASAVAPEVAPGVVRFMAGSIDTDGGFKGRDGKSDIYYTVFGLETLIALGGDFSREAILGFVNGVMEKSPGDLVHLTAGIRCYATLMEGQIETSVRQKLIGAMEPFRSQDGGFANGVHEENGTAYGCFLGVAAYQDLQTELPGSDEVLRCLESLAIPGGGFTNNRNIDVASSNATAAAMVALNHLGHPADQKNLDWLFTQYREVGGFVAMPLAPFPDLLTTATSLHALSVGGYPIESVKGACRRFVNSLRSETGGFRGHCLDAMADCEYTYYGLLALGHLG